MASIKNGFTNTLIASTLNDLLGNATQQAWLGGNRIGTSTWHWNDGLPFSYTNWANGEPKNNIECMAIQAGNRFWYSNDCNNGRLISVCEVQANGTSTGGTNPPPKTTVAPGSCPNGWKYYAGSNKCFTALTTPGNYTGVNASCVAMGGQLASIHSDAENTFIYNNFNGTNDQELSGDLFAFIGLWSANADGTWIWTDGTQYDYQNWVVNPPSLANYGLILTSSLSAIPGKWYTLTIDDIQFGIVNNAICEMNLGGTPPPPATTTTPTKGTTRSGGSGTCPSGWQYFSGTNRCFTALTTPGNYTGVNASCVAMGGQLASIHSDAENTFIYQNFNGTNDQELSGDLFAFIGLWSANADGTWIWTDGTPYDYQSWVVNPPSLANYGLILTSSLSAIPGKWYTLTIDDIQFGIVNNAICAMPAN